MTVTKYKRLSCGENNETHKSDIQAQHSTIEGQNDDLEYPDPIINIPKVKARAEIGLFQKSISTLILILVYFTLSITITFYQRKLLSVSRTSLHGYLFFKVFVVVNLD